MHKKNKVIALGIILEKRMAIDIAYRYVYKVKVPGVDEPMIMSHVHDHYMPLRIGLGVKVEYDPKKPKKCKLVWDR